MFDKNMGFNLGSSGMKKTTNGCVNWFAIPNETYSGIQFVDSLIGWKCWDSIKKTTNGGMNWFSQQMPNLPHSFIGSSIYVINKDTVWLVGDQALYAPLYKTTDGGLNWGYQRADTSVHITIYNYIQFINNKIGWAYSTYYSSGIHTTTGGSDTTFFTGMKLLENFVPSGYTLGQNYPNPFNPVTKIPYELKEPSYIVLKVYDITGRMVKELVNGNWGTAKYIADFDASGLSSGIYFYRIEITSQSTTEKFIDSKKMILLK
jgi:hypothetical protein